MLYTRTFSSPRSSMSFSKAPTPGRCTSTPIKSCSGAASAISARERPIPNPISRLSMLSRPNTSRGSIMPSSRLRPYLGQLRSKAFFWPSVIRPCRSTKLRTPRRVVTGFSPGLLFGSFWLVIGYPLAPLRTAARKSAPSLTDSACSDLLPPAGIRRKYRHSVLAGGPAGDTPELPSGDFGSPTARLQDPQVFLPPVKCGAGRGPTDPGAPWHRSTAFRWRCRARRHGGVHCRQVRHSGTRDRTAAPARPAPGHAHWHWARPALPTPAAPRRSVQALRHADQNDQAAGLISWTDTA